MFQLSLVKIGVIKPCTYLSEKWTYLRLFVKRYGRTYGGAVCDLRYLRPVFPSAADRQGISARQGPPAAGRLRMDKLLHLPVWSMYLLLPVLLIILLPPLAALIKRISIARTLLLGER